MTRQTITETPPNEPWANPWPSEDLETVGHCPVCGSAPRRLLHADLVDNAFRTAPGKWTLWSCLKCSSAYLDPRPTQMSIHLAYANYYTHLEMIGKDNYESLSYIRKLRRRMVSGYTNWRYGTKATPSSRFGIILLTLLWPLKTRLDREYRHLPRPPASGGSLLDIGCGNGSFLIAARSCGWDVIGVDPDPQAVIHGLQQNLNVIQGGIEQFESMENAFDVITLNHVAEHLHDPVTAFKNCQRLLKPGGQLWLETPSINSIGHKLFKENWRGLETPRHLVLFNHESLKTALSESGYINIQRRARPSAVPSLFKASFAIANGQSPYLPYKVPLLLRWKILTNAIREFIKPTQRELVIMSCKKPVNLIN